MEIKQGDVFTWERSFTVEEVLQFAEITGDKGRHHMERNEEGEVMVHGLLTASIGTKIGGDMHYIAREMVMEYIRPVFTSDTISCEVTITKVKEVEGYKNVEVQSVYRNQKGKEVLKGTSYGIIRH
ncbi:enoyl-CoA hydratase [Pontibacillus yanchengensis]|uniref:Enoyl-CoA hydratase n=1 Tax=Pontibacillus yanchengensis TaxID=462910 RepID=A0ACC7VHG1_9BACI|nr:MaoC family dehydratase N-terminal domain-containing protein [Pontibacillus yanchengensis]MYL54125.1 enoyl-CoA hydratase [Pontibacillus yanchengensis]